MTPSQRLLCLLTAISIIIPLFAAELSAASDRRRSDNTMRSGSLRPTPQVKDALLGIVRAPEARYDTVFNPQRDSIQLSGYDKPLRTSRETVLVTNATSRPVGGLSVTVSYRDMQGRQLHERTDTLSADIPAGETRMLHLATWDTQHSYYYHRGQRPRTAGVTPYDVACRINFILYPKNLP